MITRGDELAGAVFDDTMRYRYQLWRREPTMPGTVNRTLLWVMLNPSTADERQLDATLRRCRGYADAWGFGAWEVCNLFAFRATDPQVMKAAADPVGPDNDRMILDAAQRADQIVVGWGVQGVFRGRDRAVVQLLRDAGKPLWCLKLVGPLEQPAHPLYLPADQEAQRYR